MTVTEDLSPSPTAASSDVDTQALFEEARRRRRRRYVWRAALVLVVVAGVVSGVLISIGSGHRGTPTTGATSGSVGTRHSVRTLRFAGAFVPQQVLAAAGDIWVVGAAEPGNRCEIEKVDPSSLGTRVFALPACGSDIAVGNGQIFLAASIHATATDSDAFHLEVFDTGTDRAVMKAPVDITTTGTGYAHMALAYGGGSLWLNPWSDHVLEISPTTGAVVTTITDTLGPGGGHPVVAAGPSGLWLAPGVGGPAVVERLTPLSATPQKVFSGSPRGAVLWMATVGTRTWAELTTYGKKGRPGPPSLVAFNGSGHEVLDVAAGQLGQSALAVSDDRLWAVSAGARCTGRQQLWSTSGQTGRSVAVATFASPVLPCPIDFGGSQLAVVGRSVFVLGSSDPQMLFRLTPTKANTQPPPP